MAMSFLPATVPTLSVSLPTLQPHGGIATFLHTELRLHCEEPHKVEATLPESPVDVCLW